MKCYLYQLYCNIGSVLKPCSWSYSTPLALFCPSSETSIYGNLILKKGIIPADQLTQWTRSVRDERSGAKLVISFFVGLRKNDSLLVFLSVIVTVNWYLYNKGKMQFEMYDEIFFCKYKYVYFSVGILIMIVVLITDLIGWSLIVYDEYCKLS